MADPEKTETYRAPHRELLVQMQINRATPPLEARGPTSPPRRSSASSSRSTASRSHLGANAGNQTSAINLGLLDAAGRFQRAA